MPYNITNNNINLLKDKKIAIWGFGKEGNVALAYLHLLGLDADIIVNDNEQDLFKYDIVIKSPGISIYKDIYKDLQKKGIKITSGTNIFISHITGMDKNKPTIVAITGTKGKSTTSALLHCFLNKLGKKTLIGGNFGTPLLELIPEIENIAPVTYSPFDEDSEPLKQDNIIPTEYVVAEISSYQAADLKHSFDIAVLNNLYPEHVNWHASHENYYKDKLNLLYHSKKIVINHNNDKSINLLQDNIFDTLYFNNTDGFYVKDKKLYFIDKELITLDDISLQGEHNLSNIAAVLTVLFDLGFDVAGKDLPIIKEALKDFKPLPHRLNKVWERNGLTFIDDSISTTPETTLAALEVFKDHPITLLAGGFERGQDYSELAKRICELEVRLIALPTTGKRLYDEVTALGGMAALVKDMEEAVSLAKDISPQGAIVILSPAAPSYDFYKDFQERGNLFQAFAATAN